MNNAPNNKLVSSTTLANVANRGDAQEFEILLKRYQRKIFAIAFRYTRSREDAEDIVQETFQKAFLHLHQFEGKSSFSTWLTRIAINEALMLLRKRRAARAVAAEDSIDDEAAALNVEMPHPGPDPEADYLKQEATEILHSAIGKLSATLRTAVELRELGELSTRETAKRIGVSAAAVKSRIFHGRRKLSKTLRDLGFGPKRAQRLPMAA